jgi:hypothetical protein
MEELNEKLIGYMRCHVTGHKNHWQARIGAQHFSAANDLKID